MASEDGAAPPSLDPEQGETLELINDEISGRLARLDAAGSQVDTKAAFVAGVASTAATFLAGRKDPSPAEPWAQLAYIAFAASFVLAVLAYALTRYETAPDPRRLFGEFYTATKVDALAGLAATKVAVFEANAKKHKKKVKLWWWSVGALAVGLALSVWAISSAHTQPIGPPVPIKPASKPTAPGSSASPSATSTSPPPPAIAVKRSHPSKPQAGARRPGHCRTCAPYWCNDQDPAGDARR